MFYRLVSLIFALATAATASAGTWTPPIGIPSPSFGIREQAPQTPSPWDSAVTLFYYVDETAAAATDTANPNGWPAKPRRTIPINLPAGALVEIHGTYTKDHASPAIIVCHGTADAPVFIRGVSLAEAPVFSGRWHLQGSYFVVENVTSKNSGGVKVVSPADHAVIRYSDLSGTSTSGGVSIQYNSTFGGVVNEVVVLGNNIHDNGDVNIATDQDAHAVRISSYVSNVWVVDNILHDSSGDGLQINAGSAALEATTHHIYVGRNEVYRTRQAGLFAKQSTDVVFSQNNVHDIINTSWSPSKCLGYQYAPHRVWFLYNSCSGATFGIYAGSDSGMGTGTDIFIVGNVIHNIHHVLDTYNPATSWSNAAIMLAGGTNRYIVNNTIYDTDSGINLPSSKGTLRVSNNVIGQPAESLGYSLFVEYSALAANSVVSNTFFEGQARIRWGGATVYDLGGFQAIGSDPCTACAGGTAGFVDTSSSNFRLRSTSPCIDKGTDDPVYDLYLTLYGIDIRADAGGTRRPVGGAIDIGAFEYSSTGVPPQAPSAVRVLVGGQD